MKRYVYILCMISFYTIQVFAQGPGPVEWEFTSKKVDDRTYEVHIAAEMEYPWHIYSQYTDEGGPVPTTIAFKDNPAVVLKGDPREEGSLVEKYEAVFMVDTRYFEGVVDFVQTVELKEKGQTPTILEGSVTFMACSDEQCLMPQEVEFNVILRSAQNDKEPRNKKPESRNQKRE